VSAAQRQVSAGLELAFPLGAMLAGTGNGGHRCGMSVLKHISSNASPGSHHGVPTHNVLPLLHEIRHALRRLLQSGEQTSIDLRALPFSPEEEDQIFASLGCGEVQATLDALGRSSVRETAYAGIWVVEHFNAEEDLMGRYIEITRMPAILFSQEEDIRDGLIELESRLADPGSCGAKKED
jgi:hydrogenase-1 operon protein HyaF